MVQIDIDYRGDLHCVATHAPSGSTLATDAPLDNQGRGETFSPTDLVATALGSCMLTIMGIAARDKDFAIDGARARVIKEMAADPDRRIASLTVEITLPRSCTTREQRILEAAARQCPVRQSIDPRIQVPLRFIYPE